MFDAVIHFRKIAASKSNILEKCNIKERNYILTTIHRAENTNDISRLRNIIDALNESEKEIILPLHPRTKKYIESYGLKFNNNIKVIEPVGYLEMLLLEENSSKILTDSGGVQKEAFFMKKPCITMRDETEWVETVENGWNVIVGTNKNKILDSIMNFIPLKEQKSIFGNGEAGKKIINIIENF